MFSFLDIKVKTIMVTSLAQKKVKLQLLPSGIKLLNLAELLESTKMGSFVESLKQYYECIILGTPPVVIVTDAQLVVHYADGSLLVVAVGEVDFHAPIKAKGY